MLGVAARKTKEIDDGGGTASRFVHQQTGEALLYFLLLNPKELSSPMV